MTFIGEGAFEDCGFTSITIPERVTTISNHAFERCSELSSITITNGVTSIGDYAFGGCYKLTSISIPNNVTIIGKGAFNSTPLTSVTIGSNVSSIGNYAFVCYNTFAEFCSYLKSIVSLNPTPPILGGNTFASYNKTILKVPVGSKEVYQNAEEWKNFMNIEEFDPTSIQIIILDKDIKSPVYDLNGRRLNESNTSINIIGGKKVMKH